MRATRVVAVMLGGVLSMAGFAALVGGGVLVAAQATLRDADGYYQSSTERVETATSVLLTHLDLADAGPDWGVNELLGTLRVSASSVDGGEVFVGIGASADVDRWLSGVAYEEVDSISYGPARTRTHLVAGTVPAAPPASQSFWAASTLGPGTQTLTWPSQPGNWAVVLMNADARAGVRAQVSVGMDTDAFLPAGLAAGGVGLLLLAAGIALMLLALPAAASDEHALPGAYPARVDARLDAELSRWRWLVKWLLVLPHVVVLALLWLAVLPLTVIAAIAILFTGRYPRAIFDFNVGVIRWTWRVTYYAFGVLGTDRYPPFSLRQDPTYPADYTVAYPQRLSRGLVLVKWWLLAIPHYLVVGVFAGGWTVGGDERWRFGAGGGLIGILVAVAAVVLLFTGRYQQPLYDFIMGLQRWCLRVLTYAALLRDEYPPFRLDMGGSDPPAQSQSL